MSKFQPNQLIDNRYTLIKKIGKGGFAEVWRVHDKFTNVDVAMKILAPESGLSDAVRTSYINEFVNSLQLSHPNLLRPLHYGQFEDYAYVVMPICANGSLENNILSGQRLDEQKLAQLIYQSADALAYMHDRGILHNDIKPGNILIGDQGDFLLSDFGISSQTRLTVFKDSKERVKALQSKSAMSSAMAIAYSATELFGEFPLNTPKSDIFSLGVSLYEAAMGQLPWVGQGGIALMQGAAIPNLDPNKFSPEANAIISSCLNPEPGPRPTARELSDKAKFYLANGYWSDKASVPMKEENELKSYRKFLIAAGAMGIGAILIGLFSLLSGFVKMEKSMNAKASVTSYECKAPIDVAVSTPASIPNGKLKAVIELGASGFNYFITRIGKDKSWKLEDAKYNVSLVYENMATEEQIKNGLRSYIGSILDFGVSPNDIHFVISSGAIRENAVQKIALALNKLGYVVSSVTAEQEGFYALKSILPDAYVNEAFVVDIGSSNTKLSWIEDNNPKSFETYGSKYFQRNVSDNQVEQDIATIANKIPSKNRKICFIMGGAPFELAKTHRKDKEDYTVLKCATDYNVSSEKSKSGLKIYKAISANTGCSTFIFDWNANFAIGFLLSM